MAGLRPKNPKFLSHRQRCPIAEARDVFHKRAPKRSEAIIRIVEAFRYLKGSCKGRHHLGARALRQKKCRAKRRIQLHVATCVSAVGGSREGPARATRA